jgi:hypothetical protein
VQVTFRDLTGTTYVLPVKHIDYEVGFVRIQVGVIPKQMHDQDGLRKAAQQALDCLDAGYTITPTSSLREALRKELGHV